MCPRVTSPFSPAPVQSEKREWLASLHVSWGITQSRRLVFAHAQGGGAVCLKDRGAYLALLSRLDCVLVRKAA